MIMNISLEEAQASMNLIHQTQARMRKAIASGYASSLLILWGLIWIVGNTGLHFSHRIGGRIFMVLDIVGIVATILIARRWPHDTIMKSPEARLLSRQFAVFSIFLVVYALIWALLFKPLHGHQISMYICTVCMFGYIVIGLWSRSTFMIGLGLVVTLLALIGYYFLRDYFYLWGAATGGGALLGTGLYIRRWR
jgi:hypothetical protein